MMIILISHNYNNVNVIINRTLHLKHVKRSIQKEEKTKTQSSEYRARGKGAGLLETGFFFSSSSSLLTFEYIHLVF